MAVATTGGSNEVSVRLSTGSRTLRNVIYNGRNLVRGEDYTVSGNTYTFTSAFIKTLEAGSHKITFDMSSGSDPVFTLTVKRDAPPKVVTTKTTLTIGNPSMLWV